MGRGPFRARGRAISHVGRGHKLLTAACSKLGDTLNTSSVRGSGTTTLSIVWGKWCGFDGRNMFMHIREDGRTRHELGGFSGTLDSSAAADERSLSIESASFHRTIDYCCGIFHPTFASEEKTIAKSRPPSPPRLFFYVAHRVEAVELIVASLFSDEAPLAPPSTGMAGFLRFLLLLAGHDWATSPLLVDPQGELSATDRAAATEAFSRSRDRGESAAQPSCACFLCGGRGGESPGYTFFGGCLSCTGWYVGQKVQQ